MRQKHPEVQVTCLPRPSPPASVAPGGTCYLGVPALRDTPRGGGLGGSRSRGFLSCVNKSRGHSQQCWPPSWAKGHSALQSGWLVTHWDLAGTQAPAEAAALVLEAGRPGRNGRKSKGGAPGRRRGTCTDWQELGLGPGRRPGHTSGFSSEARSVCPRGGSVYADKTETRSSACWSPLQGHLTTGPPSEWLRRDEGVGEGCFSGHPTKIPVSQSIWLSPGGAGTSTTHLMPHVLYPGAVPSQRP